MDSQQLGWGIVGPGRIAATQIAPAIADAPKTVIMYDCPADGPPPPAVPVHR